MGVVGSGEWEGAQKGSGGSCRVSGAGGVHPCCGSRCGRAAAGREVGTSLQAVQRVVGSRKGSGGGCRALRAAGGPVAGAAAAGDLPCCKDQWCRRHAANWRECKRGAEVAAESSAPPLWQVLLQGGELPC